MANIYIKNKIFDNLLIVYSPLICFLPILFFSNPRGAEQSQIFDYNTPFWLITIANVLILAHLTIGYTRSHLNKTVFKRFPIRFTFIPIFVTLSFVFQNKIYLLALAFNPIWDVVHSFMQTFGFGRIYDSKLGNDALSGRRLDIAFCFFAELYPQLVRLTTFTAEELYKAVDFAKFVKLTPIIKTINSTTMPFTYLGIAFFVYYCYRYYLLVKNGYKISKQKLILFGLTGIVNIITVTHYTIVEALVLGNLYHSIQYYAIIWYSENKNLSLIFKKLSPWFILVTLCFVSLSLGILRLETEVLPIWGAFWLTCSLMHFWYDGFIWSVRKQQAV